MSRFDLDSLPFTPNIDFATVHFFMTDPAATRVDFLSINDKVIFRDDFESANTSHRSETG